MREKILTRVVFQIELHESCRPCEFHCLIAAYLFRLTENRAELENLLMPQLKELIFNRNAKFTQSLSYGMRFGIIAAAGIDENILYFSNLGVNCFCSFLIHGNAPPDWKHCANSRFSLMNTALTIL